MARTSSWDDTRSTAKGGNFGRWVLAAVAVAVLLHLVVLYFLGRIPFFVGSGETMEWRSRSFTVEQVDLLPESVVEESNPEVEAPVPPEDSASLMMEIEELLPKLDNLEVDLSPDIAEPEVSLKMEVPALIGDLSGKLLEPVEAPEISPELVEVGTSKIPFTEVPNGRVIIDEGGVTADLPDPDQFLRDAARKGAAGLSEEGVLEGYSSLGSLLNLPSGKLNESKAALPSDLLFEYDSAALKDTARLGLMKVGMLIDRNPTMYCILEGHTDLYGADEYNLILSQKRAEAVKTWLVDALRLDGERIVVRGFGKTQPKVLEGTVDEQSLNRRVDIMMRKEKPLADPVLVRPARADVVPEGGVAEPGRAVPVEEKPPAGRAIPIPE